MSILDRLKGKQPPSVDTLSEKLATAVEAQRQAESDYRAACLAAAEGGAAEQKARTEAEKAVDRAKRDVRELRGAIKAAREYEAQAADKAAADDQAERWAAVRKHVAARGKAAKDAEAAVAKLADAMDRVAEANTSILNTAPKRPDVTGALLGGWDVEAALRLQLVKSGFQWAFNWPWGRESIPSLSQRIGEGNGYVEKIAGEHESGSTAPVAGAAD